MRKIESAELIESETHFFMCHFESFQARMNNLKINITKLLLAEIQLASKIEIRKSETFVEYQNFLKRKCENEKNLIQCEEKFKLFIGINM